MKLYIYSIKDTIQGAFMNPFYLTNDNVAMRSFKNTIQSETMNNIKMNAKDMQLFRLGEYEEETGVIKSEIEFLVNGSHYITEAVKVEKIEETKGE